MNQTVSSALINQSMSQSVHLLPSPSVPYLPRLDEPNLRFVVFLCRCKLWQRTQKARQEDERDANEKKRTMKQARNAMQERKQQINRIIDILRWICPATCVNDKRDRERERERVRAWEWERQQLRCACGARVVRHTHIHTHTYTRTHTNADRRMACLTN